MSHFLLTLRPRQNGRRFPDDTFNRIFMNENVRISIKISLKFVPKGPINNYPALVQIMAWRQSGNKPLSEPMKVSLLTHICVTRPKWVNFNSPDMLMIFLLIPRILASPGYQQPYTQTRFSNVFLWMKSLVFSWKCLQKLVPKYQVTIDNGLAPDRWQAITWTNVDPVYWRIYPALGEMS